VLAFCQSRTRNRSDAEDATQTTFMYALTGLKRGVVPEFELSWLLRIAENVCHSQRRRAHRRYERDELPGELASDRTADPAVLSERLETISSALEELPETQRRAIVLREWRGLSYHDIAAQLQTSHAAVETLLFRARRSLAKQVASLGTLALDLVPAGGRLLRSALGTGAGKAAVVAATAATVGVGTVASGPLVRPNESPAPTPVVQRVEDAPRRTTVDAAPATSSADVAQREAAPVDVQVPADPSPPAAPGSSPTDDGPTTEAAAPTSPGSEPAEAADGPNVEVDLPVAEVAPVLEPVEEVLESPLEVVSELEPILPATPVAPRLPPLELPGTLVTVPLQP
jgi:RNA polymerase sigma factor (sigma-70 family)